MVPSQPRQRLPVLLVSALAELLSPLSLLPWLQLSCKQIKIASGREGDGGNLDLGVSTKVGFDRLQDITGLPSSYNPFRFVL